MFVVAQAKCVPSATLYRLKAILSMSRFDFRNVTLTSCMTMNLFWVSSTAARTLVKANIAHDRIAYFIIYYCCIDKAIATARRIV